MDFVRYFHTPYLSFSFIPRGIIFKRRGNPPPRRNPRPSVPAILEGATYYRGLFCAGVAKRETIIPASRDLRKFSAERRAKGPSSRNSTTER